MANSRFNSIFYRLFKSLWPGQSLHQEKIAEDFTRTNWRNKSDQKLPLANECLPFWHFRKQKFSLCVLYLIIFVYLKARKISKMRHKIMTRACASHIIKQDLSGATLRRHLADKYWISLHNYLPGQFNNENKQNCILLIWKKKTAVLRCRLIAPLPFILDKKDHDPNSLTEYRYYLIISCKFLQI